MSCKSLSVERGFIYIFSLIGDISDFLPSNQLFFPQNKKLHHNEKIITKISKTTQNTSSLTQPKVIPKKLVN